MTNNLWIELSDDSAQNVSGGYYFGDSSYTKIREELDINKNFKSKVEIKGGFAGAEADATYEGPQGAAQAVTASFTGFKGGYAKSTSVSAIPPVYYY